MKQKYGPFGPNQEYFSSKEAIKKRLNQEITTPSGYSSQFTADVLFKHHPRYQNVQKSIRFRLKPDRAVLLPDGSGQLRWSSFSFKDIFSPPTWRQIVENQLQKRWANWRTRIINFRTHQDTPFFPVDKICPLCQNRPCEEVDHVYPYHADIKREAIDSTICSSVIQNWIVEEWLKPFNRKYDKLLCTTFFAYDKLTSKGKYVFLCKPCHVMITAKRKQ